MTVSTDCSKRVEFCWDEAAQQSFDSLKYALCTTPVLVCPDFSKTFLLSCDASSEGIGYILSQKDEIGHDHPICFGRRALTKAEQFFSITHLECLALILHLLYVHLIGIQLFKLCHLCRSYPLNFLANIKAVNYGAFT